MTERDEKKALKLFGETDDPTEAGWILPDGKMVYWADSHECMAIKLGDYSRDDIIQQGWIRAVNNGGEDGKEVGIEISADGELTIRQLRRIQELVERTDRECFLIEWTDKDGRHLTKELPADPEEVMYCIGAMHRAGFERVYKEVKRRKGETE